jgi:hypothetical protein
LIPFNLNRFKQTLNCSNFNQSKKNLPKLKKFEIKYGVEGFDKRNNFPYINFFKSEVYFELKIKDFLRFEFEGNLRNFFLVPRFFMKLGQGPLFEPKCQLNL